MWMFAKDELVPLRSSGERHRVVASPDATSQQEEAEADAIQQSVALETGFTQLKRKPQFYVVSMTEEDANRIIAWSYEPPYDFYNMNNDPEDLAALLNLPEQEEINYAVHNGDQELIGFFEYQQPDPDTVVIGLGLRPDQTGKGLGLAFVKAGIAFARKNFTGTQIQLSVALFNKRAMRVYERAGFVAGETFMVRLKGNDYKFLRMARSLL
jgi:ribosomal-protein-alanine N-acetyltransferase